VGDAAADENQSACHYVGAYDAAGYAGQQTTYEGVLKKCVLQ
jgi:hypothetical protein